MNKQELIKKYENEWKEHSPFNETASYALMVKSFLDQLKKMDEPQKVTIPQFVANWYEKHKYDFEFCIWDYVYRFDMQEDTSFKKWFNDPNTKPFQTLVNMHQFGYEVEKEKRYTVKLKYVKGDDCYLKRVGNDGKNWILSNYDEYTHLSAKHTRKELEEAGFGEVFNSTLFEVEEVE